MDTVPTASKIFKYQTFQEENQTHYLKKVGTSGGSEVPGVKLCDSIEFLLK
jgi:hypothetical protein